MFETPAQIDSTDDILHSSDPIVLETEGNTLSYGRNRGMTRSAYWP
jgi:hypothetical protein